MEKKKILVVEDEKIVAMDIKKSLERIGYTVTGVVASGKEAIKKVFEDIPDLILMDIKLKGEMDGIEAAGEIRSQFNLPVIYLTAYTDEKTLERAKITEPFGYLLKPFEERELKITIDIAIYKHELERRLKESELKYKKLSEDFHTLLEAIPHSLILLSSDLEVIWANKATCPLFEVEIEGLKGKTCHSLFHGRTSPCENCPVIKSLNTGECGMAQIRTFKEKTLDVKVFPVKDMADGKGNFLLLAVDITEKLQLQAEALQMAQLASIGELAAGVAHEINNPINVIINYGEIMEEIFREYKIEEDLPGRIIKEGDRISNIVRSLLSFARQGKEEKKPVHISEVISETLVLVATHIKKDAIELKIDISEDLPEIMMNPQKMQQVFLNILGNARDALNQKYPERDKNKIIEIRAGKAVINDISCLRIICRDHGTGIPEDIKEKVINPFFTTKPVGRGTGLGLSISRNIVMEHGGRLLVESREGEFTDIIVELPVEDRSDL